MLTTRNLSVGKVVNWSAKYVVFLLAYTLPVAWLYYSGVLAISVPWLPVSVIGTAVAFYVGFKNNNTYDRLWEARKIWGGIVNDSRTWGMMVDGFVSNLFAGQRKSPEEIHQIKQRLIYRHIAWLYAHRSQLLIPTPWEHISQGGHIGKTAQYFQRNFGVGLLDDSITEKELRLFLPADEYQRLINHANTATQIVNEQSRDLRGLREQGMIDDFRHMEMENVLKSFYTLQGRNERIKKFPLPRQYAIMSSYFVWIFIGLLPFSMIPELMKIENWGVWLAIPLTLLIGWVYLMMELVGDFSENPFQGMANDIPMMSLCRTIEIDLREMLGETELPPPIQSKDGILM